METEVRSQKSAVVQAFRPAFCSFALDMSDARVRMGKSGEDLACRELERRGYAIIARRYRVRGGELDVVARDGETIVFVEVKARAGRMFGDAVEAVTPLKQLRMTRLAEQYLMRYRLSDCPCRFDVVSIHYEDSGARVDVFQNAFDAL
jgi:putative endonuclease